MEIKMECNVGRWDRALRTAALAGTLAFGFLWRLKPAGRAATFALAGMEAFTVLTRYCPINQALGINTCQRGIGGVRSINRRGFLRTGEYLGERRPEHYAG